uniref:Uncharacterized protein n=1 Tax=Cucumis melo TaxID=3656 RepID=A0A9I9E9H2_CUCME
SIKQPKEVKRKGKKVLHEENKDHINKVEDTEDNTKEKEQKQSKEEIGEQSESHGEIISKPTLKARVKKDSERSWKTKQG